jgi:hypothetical protein
MLVIAFYYILIDLREDSLSMDFIKRTMLRYIVIIISFLLSFVFILLVFKSLVQSRETLHLNNKISVVVADKREKMKSKSKSVIIEKKTVGDNNSKIKNTVYEKSFKDIKISAFKYFNTAIIIYVVFLSINYFVHREN